MSNLKFIIIYCIAFLAGGILFRIGVFNPAVIIAVIILGSATVYAVMMIRNMNTTASINKKLADIRLNKEGGISMNNRIETSETDYDLRLMKLAKRRVKAKSEFAWHLVSYVLVNSFLIMIYLVTSGAGSYFWPIWPIMGWGLGIGMHGFGVMQLLSDSSNSDDRVMEEYNRLKRGSGTGGAPIIDIRDEDDRRN